jgi:hypothetical protein
MTGLRPAIHVFISTEESKTWMPRDKRGHDERAIAWEAGGGGSELKLVAP